MTGARSFGSGNDTSATCASNGLNYSLSNLLFLSRLAFPGRLDTGAGRSSGACVEGCEGHPERRFALHYRAALRRVVPMVIGWPVSATLPRIATTGSSRGRYSSWCGASPKKCGPRPRVQPGLVGRVRSEKWTSRHNPLRRDARGQAITSSRHRRAAIRPCMALFRPQPASVIVRFHPAGTRFPSGAGKATPRSRTRGGIAAGEGSCAQPCASLGSLRRERRRRPTRTSSTARPLSARVPPASSRR